MATIQARNLTKHYGGHPAVSELSFDVLPGSVTGFLGPNGAGKSTAMRLMLGLDHGGGTTTFDGRRFVELDRPLQHVGALLEAKAFHPTRTARNHLRMLAAANRIPTRRVDEVLEQVGLAPVAGKRPGSFSLGMAQRLGLAAALLGDPDTLLLDEPANGLDPHGMQWLRELLRRLADEGRTVLVSSHVLAEVALMADHLVVIGKGRLIASGPIGEFVASSSHNAVLVRTPDPDRLVGALRRSGHAPVVQPDGALAVTGLSAEQIGDIAFDEGVRVHELRPRVATLEEAFLERTGGTEEFFAHDAGHRMEAQR